MPTVKEDEGREIVYWQVDCFRELRDWEGRGFTRGQIETLVMRGVDYHDAERLLRRGCSVRLAMRILR